MKVKVYTKFVELKYFNTFLSKATCFVLVLSILAIILPFIVAYNSKGFWLKRDTFHEQPDIKYMYEYIFIAETNKLNLPIFCTNIFNTSNNDMNNDQCSETKVREIDNDNDGKNDQLYFSIILNNLQDTRITGVTLILPLEYKLQTECYVQMQTIAMLQHFHSNPGTELFINGEVSLSQSGTIPCSRIGIYNAYNKSVINTQENDLKNLFTEEYFTRNLSTTVQNTYVAWKSGTGSTFEMNVQLRFPEHKIYYTPKFWQVVKFAWIQYISMYILFAWVINKLKDYIFANKYVSYYIDSNSKNKFN